MFRQRRHLHEGTEGSHVSGSGRTSPDAAGRNRFAEAQSEPAEHGQFKLAADLCRDLVHLRGFEVRGFDAFDLRSFEHDPARITSSTVVVCIPVDDPGGRGVGAAANCLTVRAHRNSAREDV
jgi:hypothetical protein